VVFYEHVYSYSLLMHENPNGNVATSTPESNYESGIDPAHLEPSHLQIIGSLQSTCAPIPALTEPSGPHIETLQVERGSTALVIQLRELDLGTTQSQH